MGFIITLTPKSSQTTFKSHCQCKNECVWIKHKKSSTHTNKRQTIEDLSSSFLRFEQAVYYILLGQFIAKILLLNSKILLTSNKK